MLENACQNMLLFNVQPSWYHDNLIFLLYNYNVILPHVSNVKLSRNNQIVFGVTLWVSILSMHFVFYGNNVTFTYFDHLSMSTRNNKKATKIIHPSKTYSIEIHLYISCYQHGDNSNLHIPEAGISAVFACKNVWLRLPYIAMIFYSNSN